MMYDMTFCVADCTNAGCERNLNFITVPERLEIYQADFSDCCDMFEEHEGGTLEDYDGEIELDFND